MALAEPTMNVPLMTLAEVTSKIVLEEDPLLFTDGDQGVPDDFDPFGFEAEFSLQALQSPKKENLDNTNPDLLLDSGQFFACKCFFIESCKIIHFHLI